MLFEWDEDKRRRNVSDHGVDFVDMVQVFDGRPIFTYRSPRNDEDRWGTVAIVQGKFYLVVWTPRGERKRIISAYRADDWEIREYRALYG
jgi:uncharacterized DUF497 family protein